MALIFCQIQNYATIWRKKGAAMVKGIICDIGGVLYEGNMPIKGAIEAIAELKKSYKICFATNTTRRAPCTIISKLNKMGFNINENELLTTLAVVKEMLQKRDAKAYGLLTQDASDFFGELLSSDKKVDFVVVGDAAENFNYTRINRAFRHLQDGAKLIAAAKNRYFKDSDGKLSLDAGPFVKALEYASSLKAEIVGKPSAEFFNLALKSMNLKPQEVVMVGDDIESDIQGAQDAGIRAILVRTGKYKPSDLDKPIYPDEDIASISKLPEILKKF